MIELTKEGLKHIFPTAPQPVLDAFLAKQKVLEKAGVNHTRNRLAYAFAQVEHESGCFKHMRENINYSPSRAVQVWPNRFKSVEEVYKKTGSWDGDDQFKLKLMDYVYGGRMGNRPGTHDGSTYIGRGGPQVTGADGYKNVGKHGGVDIFNNPSLAESASIQPELMAGFVAWKNLNTKADLGDFIGYVKTWNGGTNGLADRQHKLAGNLPYIERLKAVEYIKPVVDNLPGKPPTPEPPKEVVNNATSKERAIRTAGGAGVATGGGAEASKQVGIPVTKDVPLLSPMVTYAFIGIGVAVIIVASILIARKVKVLKANWN